MKECRCQNLMDLQSKHHFVSVCVRASMRTICHTHLASVVAEWGIPIIIIKPTLFFYVWGETTFPPATTFQPNQITYIHTHTLVRTHTYKETLLCAVLQAKAIVRVITWSVVCLVTFSLYELRAFYSPSILSMCVWLLFSFFQQRGHWVLHYLANPTI